ncbi:MAG: hypothetical protein V8R40_02600 [Dysosmobacter sp.]
MTKQNRTTNLSVLLLLLVIVLCASYLLRMDNQVPELEYSQVRQLFEQEKVEIFTFPDEHTLELHCGRKSSPWETRIPFATGSMTLRFSMKISTI